MDVAHYWTVDQVGRLLGVLAVHNRLQARALALIMWRTGLRIPEALELEWRDLDYRSEVPTLLVRKSKSGKPRTVPLHDEMVQLFTNWPVKHSPRDPVAVLLPERRRLPLDRRSGGRTRPVASDNRYDKRPFPHGVPRDFPE